MSKPVSQLDANGYFVATVIADESPLEPGVYLLPGGAIDALPPKTPPDMRARWTGATWAFEPRPPEQPQPARDAGPQELQAQLTTAIQMRLDAFAQTRGYDSILSACTYVASSVPRFAAEGRAALAARDATWAAAHTLLADVQAGTRPMPASLADIEAALPALTWPSTDAEPDPAPVPDAAAM